MYVSIILIDHIKPEFNVVLTHQCSKLSLTCMRMLRTSTILFFICAKMKNCHQPVSVFSGIFAHEFINDPLLECPCQVIRPLHGICFIILRTYSVGVSIQPE